MSYFGVRVEFYKPKKHKKLLIVPIILLIVSLFFIQNLKYGIDFKGGILLIAPIQGSVDLESLEAEIEANFELEDLELKTTHGVRDEINVQFIGEKTILEIESFLAQERYEEVIENSKLFTGDLALTTPLAEQADTYYSKAREEFKNTFVLFLSEEIGVEKQDFSIKDIGPAIGSLFLGQAQSALITAFVLMSLLVFFFYRTPIVSFAIIQAAIFDVIFALGVMGMLGIPLTLGTFAALLMLIGYSVDTDIMLTSKILKRKQGTRYERAQSSIKTGLMMTGTLIGAMSVLLTVSMFANIELLTLISTVILAGLIADLFSTWFTNVSLVLWYAERKSL